MLRCSLVPHGCLSIIALYEVVWTHRKVGGRGLEVPAELLLLGYWCIYDLATSTPSNFFKHKKSKKNPLKIPKIFGRFAAKWLQMQYEKWLHQRINAFITDHGFGRYRCYHERVSQINCSWKKCHHVSRATHCIIIIMIHVPYMSWQTKFVVCFSGRLGGTPPSRARDFFPTVLRAPWTDFDNFFSKIKFVISC